MKRWGQRLAGFAVLICAMTAQKPSADGAEKLTYNRDIRPILAENCFACHGPDSAARKANLRLDRREDAVDAKAISPGKLGESELLRRIFSTNPDELMPPANSHKELKPEQKERLKTWVLAGAEYEPHWSLIAPRRPELPAVKQDSWVRNPIDRFVLARLETEGLSPAPEADKRTLARRVSLDLTGLPPAPELVEAFVADQSPNAYEKLVDKLLESPAWGEHRGRYWLDVARYADTHGIHFDNYREIWAYRNWVIDAFNRNLPFDQFTIEQLAGDLLPDASLDQKIASGFNRCNITTNEGGIIDEEYAVLYARDRTETVSTVWLGLTLGCAVCHDHKFDPFTQKDFYSLSAFFNNTTQAVRDGNIKDTPPVLQVPQPEDRPRWQQLQTELAAARQAVEDRKQQARGDFDAWLAKATPEILNQSVPTNGLALHAKFAEGQGKSAKVQLDGNDIDVALSDNIAWQSGAPGGAALQPQGNACEFADFGDFEKDQPFTCSAWIKAPPADTSGAIASRMDNVNDYRGWDFWIQRRQIGMHISSKWSDDALKVVGKPQIKPNEWVHVAVTYDGSAKASGVKIYYDGQPQQTLVEVDKLQSSIKAMVPFKVGQRNTSEPLTGVAISDLRIYKRALDAGEVESVARASRFAAIIAKPADQRTDAEKNEVYPWWLASFDVPYREKTAALAKLTQEEGDIKSRGTIAHVMHEKSEEAKAYILARGEYDKRGEPVKPITPVALPPLAADTAHNRLGFAQWLLAPSHPLTARVTVNRCWQELFGTGLVRTSGDFGVTGELPSHPELLDWLAIEFRERNWDVKQFYKLLVTSATYRQSARTTPEKLERDPFNRLLSRGSRFRMDAEMIRDCALAASGLLVPRLGGPSVKPYQPDGVWEAVAMNESNTKIYRRDAGENLYRRSMYWFWKRSAPPASMEIFNAPAREMCTVRRERTDTPLQALVTLNDPQFVEAARVLAQKALKDGGATDDAKIGFITARLIARPLKAEELKVVKDSLVELSAYYRDRADDANQLLTFGDYPADEKLPPDQLAAWTMLVNELMNLDEVLNK